MQIRKTKIVATIGPASHSPEMIRAMVHAGMNVARLNLSHGSPEAHSEQIAVLRDAAQELGRHIAIMIDTRGIEIRTGQVEDGAVELVAGESFELNTDSGMGNAAAVSISYLKLHEEVRPGIPILLDDGAIELEVEAVEDGVIHCKIIHGGKLGEGFNRNRHGHIRYRWYNEFPVQLLVGTVILVVVRPFQAPPPSAHQIG